MASKRSTLEMGLFVIPVRLEVAVDPDDDPNKRTVCTGGGSHEPTRIKQHTECPECGKTASSHWGFPERGYERDGKLVLLTAEEIKAAEGEPIKRLVLEFRPRDQVYATTVAGDSVQNVIPDRGGEKGYVALRDALRARPGVVAVTVWAPSTKNALWVMEVVDDRLVVSKRCWPEYVRATPVIPPAEVTDAERTMLGNYIEATMSDFDVAEYRHAARVGMEQLIASRLGDAASLPASTGTVSASTDMLAALQASIDKINKPAKPAARKASAKPRKRATKKAAPLPKAG